MRSAAATTPSSLPKGSRPAFARTPSRSPGAIRDFFTAADRSFGICLGHLDLSSPLSLPPSGCHSEDEQPDFHAYSPHRGEIGRSCEDEESRLRDGVQRLARYAFPIARQ